MKDFKENLWIEYLNLSLSFLRVFRSQRSPTVTWWHYFITAFDSKWLVPVSPGQVIDCRRDSPDFLVLWGDFVLIGLSATACGVVCFNCSSLWRGTGKGGPIMPWGGCPLVHPRIWSSGCPRIDFSSHLFLSWVHWGHMPLSCCLEQMGLSSPLFFSVDNASLTHTIFFSYASFCWTSICSSLLLGCRGSLLPACFPNGTVYQRVCRHTVPK